MIRMFGAFYNNSDGGHPKTRRLRTMNTDLTRYNEELLAVKKENDMHPLKIRIPVQPQEAIGM